MDASRGSSSLGPVVAEVYATAGVLLLIGSALVVAALAHERSALLSAVEGAVIVAVVGAVCGRPLWRNSAANARQTSEGGLVEKYWVTVGRAVFRTALIGVPLASAVTLVPIDGQTVPPSGYALMGGMVLATGLFEAATGLWFRRWEDRHRQVLLRQTRRWTWTDGRSGDSENGARATSQRSLEWPLFVTASGSSVT